MFQKDSKKHTVTFVVIHDILKSTNGSDHVLCNFANRMIKKGYHAQILCPHLCINSRFFPLSPEVKFFPFACEKYPFFLHPILTKLFSNFALSKAKRHFLRRWVFWWRVSFQLGTCLKKAEFSDLIIATGPREAYVLQCALRRLGQSIPIITMVQSSFDDLMSFLYPIKLREGPDYKQLLHREGLWNFHLKISDLISKSLAVQILQPAMIDQIKIMFPKAHVIYIPEVVPQYSRNSELTQKKIIYVARITPDKRQDLLIRAFAHICQRFPDWRLEFWGSTQVSSYEASLKELICQLNLSKQVMLCGETHDIEELLMSSSVMCFPSAREGFCLAMTEAMSAGLAIIGCKDAPGVRDLIRDGENGLLCEPTTEAMAKALTSLLSQLSLRQKLGRAARESMRTYAPENVWSLWDDLLRNTLHY